MMINVLLAFILICIGAILSSLSLSGITMLLTMDNTLANLIGSIGLVLLCCVLFLIGQVLARVLKNE